MCDEWAGQRGCRAVEAGVEEFLVFLATDSCVASTTNRCIRKILPRHTRKRGENVRADESTLLRENRPLEPHFAASASFFLVFHPPLLPRVLRWCTMLLRGSQGCVHVLGHSCVHQPCRCQCPLTSTYNGIAFLEARTTCRHIIIHLKSKRIHPL